MSALILALVGSGCRAEDPLAPPVPTALVATSSAYAIGIAGGHATPLPSVTVTDQRGDPMDGVQVTFAVTAGGGTIIGVDYHTNASGVATLAGWTLGTAVGTNTVTASSGSLTPVIFTATTTVGPPSSVIKSADDDQSATVNSKVPVPPKVIVKDINGNVLPGVRVSFAGLDGRHGGWPSAGSQVTNALGEASVEWTLGRRAGTNVLRASVPDVPPVTFTATGTPGPITFVAIEPNWFGILIGDTVTVRATAHDTYANVISGTATSWEATEPVASISDEGLLTGLSEGYAVLKASIGGATNSLTGAGLTRGVTVFHRVDSVVFSRNFGSWTEQTLQPGAFACVGLYAYGSLGSTRALRWTPMVSDPSVVSVTEADWQFGTQCFRALRSGTVTVTGSFGGATASKTLTVP